MIASDLARGRPDYSPLDGRGRLAGPADDVVAEDGPVSAGVLGLVEPLVGRGDQGGDRPGAARRGERQAEAGGDPQAGCRRPGSAARPGWSGPARPARSPGRARRRAGRRRTPRRRSGPPGRRPGSPGGGPRRPRGGPVADVVAVGVVDPLEVVDVEHQDRRAQPSQRPAIGQGAELGEEVGPVVQAGERVADGPLEHLALELLLARVGADELDDHVGAELEPVAVLDPDRGVLGEPPAVEERAVGAPQVGQPDLPLVVGSRGRRGSARCSSRGAGSCCRPTARAGSRRPRAGASPRESRR